MQICLTFSPSESISWKVASCGPEIGHCRWGLRRSPDQRGSGPEIAHRSDNKVDGLNSLSHVDWEFQYFVYRI